jgi:antitoxin component YwqK of YwqJK toxin-antitoxin module
LIQILRASTFYRRAPDKTSQSDAEKPHALWNTNGATKMTSNKNSNRFSLRSLLGVVLVAGLAFTLAGCKEEAAAPTPPAQGPTQPAPAPALIRTVKLMPPESGENQRIYKKTPDGTLVEMTIDYRDGRLETLNFRPDGSVARKQEFYPYTGVLKSTIEYASDGTTVTSETLNRGTGTLELTRKRLADGTTETTRYRVDGKRLHSVTHELNGALVDATFYAQDGKTLRAKAKSLSASESEVTFYNAAGQVEKIRTSKSTSGSYSGNFEISVSVLRADSTIAYKQFWSGYQSSYYRSLSLKTVEEYEADGKTLKRKLTLDYSGTRISEAVVYENGVKKTVRSYRWDGTLETEKTFDSTGTVTNTQTHTSSENLKETVAPELVNDQSGDDPLAFKPGDFQ